MAGEKIRTYGATKTLEANGASTTNNSISQANDASYGIVADGASFPDAEFVFSGAFATGPTVGASLDVYARPLNIDSTSDAEAPTTTYLRKYIGSFIVNNVTTTQYCDFVARDVPAEADYYLLNNGTGQTLSSGWTLKVKPVSHKLA